MRHHNFCPVKQQTNYAKLFTVYVLEIEELEYYYECLKYGA